MMKETVAKISSHLAREHPGYFQKVVTQSGSFWHNGGALTEAYRALPVEGTGTCYEGQVNGENVSS